jgi:hypothetical protein
MTITRRTLLILTLACTAAFAAEDVVQAIHGTVVKIDQGSKIVVVKTADGVEHSLHFVAETSVHGAKAVGAAAKGSWGGLKEGSEVVAHYTKRGTEDTAVEIDKVGKDGLKAAKGTVTEADRGGKKLVLETGKGTKETFDLTDHATDDSGKDVAKATDKGAKVTVYYTEDAGKKVAHFFEAL